MVVFLDRAIETIGERLAVAYQLRFLPVVEKARADIAAALTPEQRAKFDKMLKGKERLWKR